MSLPINANTLTVAKPMQVNGMIIVKSEKTGAQRISLTSKRDFTKLWLTRPENKDKPKKQAARDFEAYRQGTLKEFNAQLATAIAGGSIVAERINADKTGDLRNISLVRRSTREQDANKAALAKVAELTGLSVEELMKKAKEHTPEAIVEVSSSPVVENAGVPVETPA